jgi:hypothetical protein
MPSRVWKCLFKVSRRPYARPCKRRINSKERLLDAQYLLNLPIERKVG